MSQASAHAKINLALVVGALRGDGKHEVVTVLQRIELHDVIELEPERDLVVEGYEDDTIVRRALAELADTAGVMPAWRARIDKRIPVAAGLGGGSSDAATALQLANATLPEPLSSDALHGIAAELGADVPFFLRSGAQLGLGDGTELSTLDLPTGYSIVLVVPHDVVKDSTRTVYEAFDTRDGASGFVARADALRHALAQLRTPRELAELPPNDLASSPVATELRSAGAFRADVSGAGPAVYGLFEEEAGAARAARSLAHAGRVFVTRPVAAADQPRVAR